MVVLKLAKSLCQPFVPILTILGLENLKKSVAAKLKRSKVQTDMYLLSQEIVTIWTLHWFLYDFTGIIQVPRILHLLLSRFCAWFLDNLRLQVFFESVSINCSQLSWRSPPISVQSLLIHRPTRQWWFHSNNSPWYNRTWITDHITMKRIMALSSKLQLICQLVLSNRITTLLFCSSTLLSRWAALEITCYYIPSYDKFYWVSQGLSRAFLVWSYFRFPTV